MNNLLREVPYSIEVIRKALEVHAETQPWYPELKKGIRPTLKSIEEYRKKLVEKENEN